MRIKAHAPPCPEHVFPCTCSLPRAGGVVTWYLEGELPLAPRAGPWGCRVGAFVLCREEQSPAPLCVRVSCRTGDAATTRRARHVRCRRWRGAPGSVVTVGTRVHTRVSGAGGRELAASASRRTRFIGLRLPRRWGPTRRSQIGEGLICVVVSMVRASRGELTGSWKTQKWCISLRQSTCIGHFHQTASGSDTGRHRERGKGRLRNEKGQGWVEGGDGWRAHQFLKAEPSSAAESVKFTLLISCNNL